MVYFAPVKMAWAINPAIGGKKNVLARRMNVNLMNEKIIEGELQHIGTTELS